MQQYSVRTDHSSNSGYVQPCGACMHINTIFQNLCVWTLCTSNPKGSVRLAFDDGSGGCCCTVEVRKRSNLDGLPICMFGASRGPAWPSSTFLYPLPLSPVASSLFLSTEILPPLSRRTITDLERLSYLDTFTGTFIRCALVCSIRARRRDNVCVGVAAAEAAPLE